MRRLNQRKLAALSLPAALLAGCCSDGSICLTRHAGPPMGAVAMCPAVAAGCPRPAYVTARPTPEPVIEPALPEEASPLPPARERPLPTPSSGPTSARLMGLTRYTFLKVAESGTIAIQRYPGMPPRYSRADVMRLVNDCLTPARDDALVSSPA